MQKLLLLLMINFLLFTTKQAYACGCPGSTEESSAEIIEKAYFIGRMRVSEVESIDDRAYDQITLVVVEPYTKLFYGVLSAIYIPAAKSCGFGVLKVGDEREFIIFEDDAHHFRIASRCSDLTPAHWKKLRQDSARKKMEIEKERAGCISQGGIWDTHGLFAQPWCLRPASDAGKECRNSSECIGLCIASLTSEQERLLTEEFGKHVLNMTGSCSERQAVPGCAAYVNDGRVTEIMCED